MLSYVNLYVSACKTNTKQFGARAKIHTNFAHFVNKVKLMSWLTKLKLKQKYSSETCIDLCKKNVIFGVQNSIQKKDKSITIRGIKHKTNIKKKNRKYIYVYL